MKLKLYKTDSFAIPLATCRVQAGFPSPAEDHMDAPLNLNKLIIKHPAATFFLRVEGDSMKKAQISSGDLLVVDRSLIPKNGQIVLAILDGEFTVKRIKKERNKIFLVPENSNFTPIEVSKESDFQIWGVVTFVIHQCMH